MRPDLRAIVARFSLDFKSTFDRELAELAPLVDDGLVDLSPDWIRVTELGRRLVRNVCVPFDAHLRTSAPGLLAKIPFAPIAVVATVFDQPLDVPDAFGFLAPRGEGLRILGTTYDTSLFADRAPTGTRMFRTMVGGRCDPHAVDLDDDALTEVVLSDLRRAWGRFPDPRSVHAFRHRLGITQCEHGHADRLAAIEAACPPGVTLAGSSYRGVSLNACIREAADLARSREV